jgi:hypothetical protein
LHCPANIAIHRSSFVEEDMMKAFMLAATAALCASPLAATPAGAKTLFACSLGKKRVTVTAEGAVLRYRFGTAAKAELAISGTARSGTIFYRSDRYAGMEYQMRFARGGYSYIVYAMEGNGNTGARAISGLTVLRGTKRIADMSCTPYAEFAADYDYSALPEDGEAYSAM